MSDNSSHFNPAMNGIRRLDNRLNATSDRMADFMRRENAGEQPDPTEFTKILEQRMTIKNALQAQMKLYEKPIKTVLNDIK